MYYSIVYLLIVVSLVACTAGSDRLKSTHPPSEFISGIEFDLDSIVSKAPGSDNWAVTWGLDDVQYTTWGDGGGFGGTNKNGRVSLGIGKITGSIDQFKVKNIWGGAKSLAPAQFTGKSYGLLAVEQDLWMWRTGDGSDNTAYQEQQLFRSSNRGISWTTTPIKFMRDEFASGHAIFAPTFLQFGPGYQGRFDDYIYIYAPIANSDSWEVQKPGEIVLFRAPIDSLTNRKHYEFFAGLKENGQPRWSHNLKDLKSVFSDTNGVMRTAVNYNQGLNRFFLITQQVSRFKESGHIGIYESKFPWGPWFTVLFDSPWKLGLQTGKKTVYWNFSNKWTSSDGEKFALIYTGPGADNFGLVRGQFDIGTL